MKTKGYIIGSTASTIQVTPPNFSFMVTSFFVGNPGTATADNNETITIRALNYGTIGTVTGTVEVGYFPQVAGSYRYTDEDPQMIFPAGSYITAFTGAGSLTFTYNGSYVYYRE